MNIQVNAKHFSFQYGLSYILFLIIFEIKNCGFDPNDLIILTSVRFAISRKACMAFDLEIFDHIKLFYVVNAIWENQI